MWFWWFMLGCDILVPVVMITSGYTMRKYPPKKINGAFGYRTARSMKNQDTWNFAHRFFGERWQKIGMIMLPITAAAHIPFYSKSDSAISIAGAVILTIQIAVMLIPIGVTEHALAKNFNKDGTRI